MKFICVVVPPNRKCLAKSAHFVDSTRPTCIPMWPATPKYRLLLMTVTTNELM